MSTRTLRPLGHRILVRPDKKPDQIGGIYVPEAVKLRATRPEPIACTVIAVGPGVKDLKEGMRIMVAGSAPSTKVSGSEDRIMSSKDVELILE